MPYFLSDRLKSENGVSLIELLLVIALVGFLVLLMANFPNSITLIGKANHQSTALKIASKALEDKRGLQYANLANGETPLSDTRLLSLPSSTGLVLVEDCDPLICTQGEEVKQVFIKVTWQEGGKLQEINLKTLISEGGLSK